MVSPVSQNQTASKPVKTSIFYVNDVHSNIRNLGKLKNASDEFDTFVPSEDRDKLKFSAGDIGVGRDKSFNSIAVDFQNITNIMASAGGNHEFDLNKKDLAEVLKGAKYKLLGLNVEIPQTAEANKQLRDKMISSYIQEENGHKYGVIGLMPFDFVYHLSDPKEYEDINILQFDKTKPLLEKEIALMKEKGVNKIILLSHCGYEADVKTAKSVEGIDVILGGHTHDLITGIEEGKNLFYSEKTGEPTIIVQAGRNGNHYGILNLEFDEAGVVKKAQNNVIKSKNFANSLIMDYFINKVLGKPQLVGVINSVPSHEHTLIDENPSVNFLADAERKELGVDIAMINAGNIRASIEKGNLTTRDLQIITPFDNKIWILKLTEKELVDAVKVGAKSLSAFDHTPGILQFSGLKYTMTKQGKVKEIIYVDAKGNETPVNVQNPSTTKTYRVAVDDFIAKGGNNYLSGRIDCIEKKFDFDKNKLVIDYIKKLNQPVDIKPEKRINIVD